MSTNLCKCGAPLIKEGKSLLKCTVCENVYMIFKRPDANEMIRKWQNMLGCSEQEAATTVITLLGKIAESVQGKEK